MSPHVFALLHPMIRSDAVAIIKFCTGLLRRKMFESELSSKPESRITAAQVMVMLESEAFWSHRMPILDGCSSCFVLTSDFPS